LPGLKIKDMRKVWYLSTCSTCTKLIKELNINLSFVRQDIKSDNISEKELDELAQITGSYDSLFSRKARNYKALGLAKKSLSEQEIKKLILNDYTFLKRPVIRVNDEVFAGSSKETINRAKTFLNGTI
jgi:arsenate reductase (glutaredoxin)